MILRRKIKTVKKFFILLFVGHLPANKKDDDFLSTPP
jgi:hypothetical protein